MTFVGLAQTDMNGDVNVSRFGNRVAGPGGFINITQNSKKVVFCGMFSIGSEEVVENGKLRITKEGTGKKFVEKVDQITFSGAFAAKRSAPILFVTERCVMKLENQKLILTEIAPGIDVEKDIIGMMEFRPEISPDLKVMDPEMFLPKWGHLKETLIKPAAVYYESGDEIADELVATL